MPSRKRLPNLGAFGVLGFRVEGFRGFGIWVLGFWGFTGFREHERFVRRGGLRAVRGLWAERGVYKRFCLGFRRCEFRRLGFGVEACREGA